MDRDRRHWRGGKSHYARALQARARLHGFITWTAWFWRGEWAVPEFRTTSSYNDTSSWRTPGFIEGYIDPALAERARVRIASSISIFRVSSCEARSAADGAAAGGAGTVTPSSPGAAHPRLPLDGVAPRRVARIVGSLRGVDPAKVVRVHSPSQLNSSPIPSSGPASHRVALRHARAGGLISPTRKRIRS